MKKVLILFLLIFVVGCSKGYTRMDSDTHDHGTDSEVVTEDAFVSEEYMQNIDLDSDDVIKEIDLVFKDVLFDFNKYDIKADGRYTMDTISSWLQKNQMTKLIIEGHCDERGTNEYNLALGEKRARVVKNYLVSLGVSSSRISLLTYGEERPTCTSHSENCWQLNRRAHFVVTE
jgi:peptidoglycan-associated lipoprotein